MAIRLGYKAISNELLPAEKRDRKAYEAGFCARFAAPNQRVLADLRNYRLDANGPVAFRCAAQAGAAAKTGGKLKASRR
jgi:hypothetical protein